MAAAADGRAELLAARRAPTTGPALPSDCENGIILSTNDAEGGMARPWLRRIGRIAVVITVVTAVLVLPWALAWPWLRNLLAGQWPTWIVIAVAIDTALLLLAAIWWLWWRLPERQVARLTLWETKARADVEDNFRKTVGQALGGAAVLIGAVAAYLQFTQQQQAIRGQLQSAHDLLISNQVAKGFEQLGVALLLEHEAAVVPALRMLYIR